MSIYKSIILIMLISIMLMPRTDSQTSKNNFEVNQLLIRVQLKENESIEQSIKITNIGLSDIDINVDVQSLDSVVTSDKSSIRLRSGLSESINLNMNGIKKGVFIGKLILSSAQEIKEIPIVVEVESKNVLVDASANPPITGKIYLGSGFSVDISLINLMDAGPTSVIVNYEIKDFDNKKILEESENIVVGKRASFIKTFNIPRDARLTSYVLIVESQYKDSFGTTTHIFDIEKKDVSNFFNGICKNNAICRVISPIFAFLLLAIFFIILKGIFRKKLISPRKMERIAAEKAGIQKKLDSIVEAYKSGFISKESYEKSRNKLRGTIKSLNKKVK